MNGSHDYSVRDFPRLPDDVSLQDIDRDPDSQQQFEMITRRVGENRDRVRSMPECEAIHLAKEAMRTCNVDPYVILFSLHEDDLDYLLSDDGAVLQIPEVA